MTKAKQKYRSSDLETMVMVIYFVSMRFYFLHFYTNTFESLLPLLLHYVCGSFCLHTGPYTTCISAHEGQRALGANPGSPRGPATLLPL